MVVVSLPGEVDDLLSLVGHSSSSFLFVFGVGFLDRVLRCLQQPKRVHIRQVAVCIHLEDLVTAFVEPASDDDPGILVPDGVGEVFRVNVSVFRDVSTDASGHVRGV